MQYQVTVSFLIYADDGNHAMDQINALLSDVEGLNDRYEICSVCDEYNIN